MSKSQLQQLKDLFNDRNIGALVECYKEGDDVVVRVTVCTGASKGVREYRAGTADDVIQAAYSTTHKDFLEVEISAKAIGAGTAGGKI